MYKCILFIWYFVSVGDGKIYMGDQKDNLTLAYVIHSVVLTLQINGYILKELVMPYINVCKNNSDKNCRYKVLP